MTEGRFIPFFIIKGTAFRQSPSLSPQWWKDRLFRQAAETWEQVSFLFALGSEDQRDNKPADDCRRDACRGRGQAAGKDADQPAFIEGVADTSAEHRAETGQRNGRAGACPVDQRLIDADAAEDNACYHISDQNPRGRQLGVIDQHLPDGAEGAADQERFA